MLCFAIYLHVLDVNVIPCIDVMINRIFSIAHGNFRLDNEPNATNFMLSISRRIGYQFILPISRLYMRNLMLGDILYVTSFL